MVLSVKVLICLIQMNRSRVNDSLFDRKRQNVQFSLYFILILSVKCMIHSRELPRAKWLSICYEVLVSWIHFESVCAKQLSLSGTVLECLIHYSELVCSVRF